MELLGEYQYFYSEKADKYYKIVDIKDINDIFSYVIQECEPVLYDRTLDLSDEKKKLTKIIETYELKPIRKKQKMSYKLVDKLFDNRLDYLLDITLRDKSPMEFIIFKKYITKDVI